MAGTSVVNKIAFIAAAEAAHPTIPALGSNVASWGTWVHIGSIKKFSDDADLDTSSIGKKALRTEWDVTPPTGYVSEDAGVLNNGIDEVTFTCYDASATLLALDSTMAVVSNVSTRTSTVTKRAMCVEVNGKWLDYYPNVIVHMDTDYGDGKKPATTKVTVKVLAGATITQGMETNHYVSA